MSRARPLLTGEKAAKLPGVKETGTTKNVAGPMMGVVALTEIAAGLPVLQKETVKEEEMTAVAVPTVKEEEMTAASVVVKIVEEPEKAIAMETEAATEIPVLETETPMAEEMTEIMEAVQLTVITIVAEEEMTAVVTVTAAERTKPQKGIIAYAADPPCLQRILL